MLDTITYQQESGVIIKNVFSESIVEDVPGEIAVLQATLENLITGNSEESTVEAQQAIANYQQQIDFLSNL